MPDRRRLACGITPSTLIQYLKKSSSNHGLSYRNNLLDEGGQLSISHHSVAHLVCETGIPQVPLMGESEKCSQNDAWDRAEVRSNIIYFSIYSWKCPVREDDGPTLYVYVLHCFHDQSFP